MCGILGFFSNRPERVPVELFYNRMESLFKQMQEKGGSLNNTDGAGFYHPYIGVVKGNQPAEELIKSDAFANIKNVPVPNFFMGHTRKTTQGNAAHNENNHPLWSDNYIIVHNGSVESDDVTSKEYNLPGIVDSNLILAALEKYGPNDFVKHLSGVAAIIIAKRGDPNQFWIYRDTRPMYLFKDSYGLWIASTEEALKSLSNMPKDKNKLFEQQTIVSLPNATLYQFHGTKKKWVSKYILTQALPTIYAASYSPYKTTSAYSSSNTPKVLSIAEKEELVEKAGYAQVAISACKSCGPLFGETNSTHTFNSSTCDICGATGVQTYSCTDTITYPLLFKFDSFEDIPQYMLSRICYNPDKAQVFMKLHDVNVVVRKEQMFVYFHNLKLTQTDAIQVTLSNNSSLIKTTVKYPEQNKYINDKNKNFRLMSRRFFLVIDRKENTTPIGMLLTKIMEEYKETFLAS